jgi:hypothetical protein
MASPQEFRLYSFVAGLYLSELQKGLQTAHVTAEMALYKSNSSQFRDFNTWAREDKTIIICSAGNHQGVVDCWAELERINSALCLPAAIFREDEQSMNGMATACGVIVPKKYWDVKFFEATTPAQSFGAMQDVPAYWEHAYEKNGIPYHQRYPVTHAEGQFCSHIKQYRLA